jgi:hypothetical protein
MQINGTSVLDCAEAGQISPVVGRPAWVDSGDEASYPLTLRFEFPLSAQLMVAALYHDVSRPGWLAFVRQRVAEVTGGAR